MNPVMPVMSVKSEIIWVSLPPDVLTAAAGLVYAIDRYFEVPPEAVFIPISSLILSHVRQSGIASALKKMAAAYCGNHELRSPITVRAIEGGTFLVLDGNSTSAVAIAAGWPELPCLLQM